MLVLSEHEGVHFDFIPVEGISGSGTPTQPCQICYAACINMMLNAYHSMFLNPVLDKDNDEMISFLWRRKNVDAISRHVAERNQRLRQVW